MTTLRAGEFGYIDWLRRRTPPNPRVLTGPGDDAAVLRLPSGPVLITTDMLLDGSCFLLEEAGPVAIGRKAMAVNLSDIAAMAGLPTAAVVSVGLPRRGGRELAEKLYEGMREMADRFSVPIVGGDTNSWDGGLVISITLLGEASKKGAVLRSGARIGDRILVTGPLGGSILGKHLHFTPRVREALTLHDLVDLHAMIDISDGLAADLSHLCTENGCGALLDAATIPVSAAAHELAQKSGREPLEHALRDGEDFELIFTVSPEDAETLLLRQPINGVQLFAIGSIVSAGFSIKIGDSVSPLAPDGYSHPLD